MKKILSEEHKRKIGDAVRGENHPMYGKHHSCESRKKISESRKARGSSAGSRNNFYGVRFIASDNPNWNGGRFVASSGYLRVNVGPGIYKYEHKIIAESVLGRSMKPREIVHHINFDKLDNRNSNLLICDKSYHHYIHNKMAALYAREHFARILPTNQYP